MSRFVAWLSIASLALVALGGPLFELWHGKHPGAGWSGRFGLWELRSGGVARELGTRLEKDCEIAARLRPFYNEALFLALRRTPARIVLGRDNWLFLASESRDYPPPGSLEHLDSTCERIASLVRWFESQGTVVVLMVVPRKSTVRPDMLPDDVRARFQPVYPLLLERLRAAGLDAPDLLAPLQRSEERTFRANDDHWDHPGARIGAEVVTTRVRERFAAQELPGRPVEAELVRLAPVTTSENVARWFGFRPDSPLLERFTDTRVAIVAEHPRTRERLHGSKQAEEIVLVGSSFSGAGLLPALFTALLGRAIEDRALAGQAAGYRLTELVRAIVLGERRTPAVLIWEFPEDFLLTHVGALTEPIGAMVELVDALELPLRSTPLEFSRAVAEGLLLSGDGPQGWAGAAPRGGETLVLDLVEPLPGDGSVWIDYTVKLEANATHSLQFEGANGQRSPRVVERPMLANPRPNHVIARVMGVNGQPVTRLRITVASTSAKFEVSRPLLLRSAAPAEEAK